MKPIRYLWWILMFSLAIPAEGAERVSSVQLKRSTIVVHGNRLAKVEIWAYPTGTGFGDQHLVFGTAVRKTAPSARETWILRLPRCTPTDGDDYLASEIVAVGFDATGSEVGREILAGLGAIELYRTLCSK